MSNVFAEAYNRAHGMKIMDEDAVDEFSKEELENKEEVQEPEESNETKDTAEPEESEKVEPEQLEVEENSEKVISQDAGEPESNDSKDEQEEPDNETETTALLEEIAKLRKQNLMWAGRVKAADKRLQEVVNSKKREIPKILNEDGTLGEGFEALKEDYPELDAFEKVLKHQQEMLNSYHEQFGAVTQQVHGLSHEVSRQAAVSALNKRWPGYENKINEEFWNWAQETVPPEILQELPYSTDVELLTNVLEYYDDQTGRLSERKVQVNPDADKEQERRNKKLAATLGVSTRAGAVVTTGAKKEEDLDELFKKVYEKNRFI